MIRDILSAVLGVGGRLAGRYADYKDRKIEIENRQVIEAYRERSNGWKDEYVTLAFTAQYPTFLVGFIIDPLLVTYFGQAIFTNAAEQYTNLLVKTFGPEGYKHVIIAVLSMAIGRSITNEVGNASKRKNPPPAAEPPKKKKKKFSPKDWLK